MVQVRQIQTLSSHLAVQIMLPVLLKLTTEEGMLIGTCLPVANGRSLLRYISILVLERMSAISLPVNMISLIFMQPVISVPAPRPMQVDHQELGMHTLQQYVQFVVSTHGKLPLIL